MGNGMQVSGANLWNMTPQTFMFFGQKMPFMNSTFGEGFVTLDPGSFCNYWMKFGNMSMPMMGGGLSGFGGGWGNIRQWFAQPFQGIMGGGGWTPSAPFTTTSSTSTTTTTYSSPEEAKYKKLYTLVSKYADSYNTKYNNDTLKKYVAEINKSTDSYADKYTKLKAIYDSNKTDINEYLLKDTGDGLDVGGKKMSALSIDTGYRTYEDSKTYAVGLVSSATTSGSVDTTKPILSLLSSYNAQGCNLIEGLCNKGVTNPNVKYKIETLKDMLVEEAEKYAKNLTPANAVYKQLITELKNMTIDNSNKNTFITKFNKLYAYTRIIAAKVAGNMINTHYPAVDANVMIAGTEEDLKKEKGIDAKDITAAKALKVKADAVIGEKTFNSVNINNKTAEEAMELLSMPEYGQLNKLSSKVTIGGTQYTVYEEAYGTEKLKYIVDGGKIYKVTISGSTGTKGDEDKAQDIQKRMVDEHDKYVEKQEEDKQKADDERNKIANRRDRERDKANCINNLNMEVKSDTNATKQLGISAKVLASAAYAENKSAVLNAKKIAGAYYVRVDNTTTIRISKNKNNEVHVEVDTDTNSSGYEVEYVYDTSTQQWSCKINKGKDKQNNKVHKIPNELAFVNYIKDTLEKIFGEKIKGWFDKESS